MRIEIKTFDELNTRVLYAILKLRVDVFIVEQNCPYPELSDRDFESTHLLYMDQNDLASYLRVYARDDQTYAIGRIVTDSKYRGKGLGRVLIQEAIAKIRQKEEVNQITIQAQSHLMSYYTSFGFIANSDEYLEDDIPHTDMILKL